MAKFPLDLSNFKKIAADKESTTLKHPDGHQIQINHRALSPKMRGQLADMPHFDDGGNVNNNNHQDISNDGTPDDYDWKKTHRSKSYADKAAEASAGANESGWTNLKKVFGYDDGGNVNNHQDISDDGTPSDYDWRKKSVQTHNEKASDASKGATESGMTQIKKYFGYADGGEVDAADSDKEASPDNDQSQPPVTVNVNSAPSAEQPQDAAINTVGWQQAAANGVAPQAQAPQSAPPSQGAPQQPGQPPQIMPPGPNTTNGLDTQIKGYNDLANAQAGLAQAEGPVYDKAAADSAGLALDFKNKNDAIQQEYGNAIHDYNNQHINPDQYWDNHSKLLTGIGLILGGIGGGGHGNQALDFLNQNINRNISAQEAEMGKKSNIITAYYHQFGNLRDATDMSRALMQGVLVNKINSAAAKAGTPMALANAKIATGPLIQQKDQLLNQISLRQTLMHGNVSDMDPAQLVPYAVPPSAQKTVLKEIGDAQNVGKNGDAIMQQFNKAIGENTITNRIMHAGFNPGSVLQLKALALPLIHDAEGRVNEFEAKTVNDLIPGPGDSEAKIQAKREGMMNFLHQKAAAPTAKAYGLDLQRFKGTSSDQSMRLPPEQKAIVDWARRNPNDPRAAIALQKLGVR